MSEVAVERCHLVFGDNILEFLVGGLAGGRSRDGIGYCKNLLGEGEVGVSEDLEVADMIMVISIRMYRGGC